MFIFDYVVFGQRDRKRKVISGLFHEKISYLNDELDNVTST